MTTTTNQDTLRSKEVEALDLMIQSVYKPDHDLRNEASELGCLTELLNIREVILNSLMEWREDVLALETETV